MLGSLKSVTWPREFWLTLGWIRIRRELVTIRIMSSGCKPRCFQILISDLSFRFIYESGNFLTQNPLQSTLKPRWFPQKMTIRKNIYTSQKFGSSLEERCHGGNVCLEGEVQRSDFYYTNLIILFSVSSTVI